jgi:hypothetical protein
VNGTNVAGATNAVFSSTTLANNDIVTVLMTSNAACVTNTTSLSNSVIATVNPVVTATVAVAANNTICAGTAASFVAVPTNAGANPTYSWTLNGTALGITTNNFTSTTLANGDVISVTMNASNVCSNPQTVVSTPITMLVTPSVTPTLSIASSAGTTVCSNAGAVQFTALPSLGGAGGGFGGGFYYRLKMIDYDGSFEYSKVIALRNKKYLDINVYPNPTNDILRINANTSDNPLRLYDILGVLVMETPQTPAQIDLSNLASGVYILQIGNWRKQIVKE